MRGKMHKRLEVRLGRRVGELVQEPGGAIRFVPDDNWVRQGQIPRLGLRFLESPDLRGNGYLPHWFENLLPEKGSLYRSWFCKKVGIRESDSMSLLAELGADLPGAVEVHAQTSASDSSVPEKPQNKAHPDMQTSLRFSLAGMQLKFSMRFSGERFVWPSAGESGDWIIKVAGDHFDELVEVEYATMLWARSIGLETPEFRQVPVELVSKDETGLMKEARKAFAIKRFDRVAGQKVHQEDFAQVFGLPPADKYGPTPSTKVPAGAYSYAAMARLIQDVAGPETLESFIRRVAFVIASGNDDAHLKNWSFQWGMSGRPVLSPCYDQVCTLSWPELGFGWSNSQSPTLAPYFGKIERFDEVDQARLRLFANSLGRPEVEETVRQTLIQCRDTWADVKDQAPKRMRDALSEHWSRVPLLRELGELS